MLARINSLWILVTALFAYLNVYVREKKLFVMYETLMW